MPVSRRDLGWYLAGVLSAAAIAFFAWLMSPSTPQYPAAVGATSAAAAAGGDVDTTPTAAAIAPPTGAPQQAAAQSAGSMNESLVRLESRLAAQGGTDADWELLAQTYEFMGRAADAQGARAHHLPGIAGGGLTAAPAAGSATPAGGGSSGVARASAAQVGAAQVSAAQLDGVVELAADLTTKVPAGATLFIVAKAVGAPGPPVGVMRTTTSQWPVRFRLDDASAMVPGRTLSSAGSVTVEARVSRSGMAAPQPGDFQSGVITVNPHDSRSVRLLIDHVIG